MTPSAPRTAERAWPWIGLALFVFAVGLYLLARYGGLWAEADSAAFTRYIRSVVGEGRLVPQGEVYPNGYVAQAVAAMIVATTGLSVEALQQWVYPLIAGITVPAAVMTYRALTGSLKAATLSALLLFTLPEFLFVILRSSHEKFGRTLMLACLFLLVMIVARRVPGRRLVMLALLFWFTCYALIATNLLIATSFVVALGTAAILGLVLGRLRRGLAVHHAGFTAVTLVLVAGAALLIYLFVFHTYQPAGHNIVIVQNTWSQIVALLTEPRPGQDVLGAYDYIATGWVDPRVYLLLSASNWLVLLGSLTVWLAQGWSWLVRGRVPERRTAWILWLLYAAFMAQGALAIVSDATGALEGNLQVRLFPSFVIAAAGVLGAAIADWRLTTRTRARFALAGVALVLSALSVVKATNEPLFSNKWNFYRESEIVALRWLDARLVEADVWTEYDERLAAALHMTVANVRNRYGSLVGTTTRDMVVSDVTRLRASRIGEPLPVPPDAWRVYDNGTTQLYHLRPESPYQP